MTLILNRRQILQLSAFGAGALVFPGTAVALSAARGFTHNVASGEPSQDSVLLWTRFVAPGESRLIAEVSETDSFDRVMAGSDAIARPDRDHTAQVTVSGLQPGRWYYYRFRGPGGAVSPVGRTRTLPDGPSSRFALGVFSCSNLPFGWFNAYAHAAARSDLDLMVHLGDYLYEYPRGNYPTPEQSLVSRVIEPVGETIHLADYRLRHAAYRADPDLRRLHQNFPMIAMWDDHEITNDPWTGGAQNHQPESEGDWEVRKAAAVRAYREWMPVSDRDYVEYRVGDLATIFRPETRIVGRDKQLDRDAALAGQSDARAALTVFRDGPWRDLRRTMLGAEQERRLTDGFRQSVAQGVRWQVLAQQVIVGSLAMPLNSASWPRPNANDPAIVERVRIGLLASSLGLPSGLDRWDGYPAARARLLRSAQEAQASLVVLSGDSHNAWAFELDHDKQPAGVEFAGQSVTSPGYEALLPAMSPRDVERAMVARNPQLKWANLERRGYLTVELAPTRVTGEWLFLDSIRERSTAIAGTHRMTVEHGRNRFA